jgi:hypothetical protein
VNCSAQRKKRWTASPRRLPGALEEERQLLQAQLMMARQDHAGAATLLQALKGSPTAGLYARFNLGVALIRAGLVAEGKAWLDDVGRAPGANEEMRACATAPIWPWASPSCRPSNRAKRAQPCSVCA